MIERQSILEKPLLYITSCLNCTISNKSTYIELTMIRNIISRLKLPSTYHVPTVIADAYDDPNSGLTLTTLLSLLENLTTQYMICWLLKVLQISIN